MLRGVDGARNLRSRRTTNEIDYIRPCYLDVKGKKGGGRWWCCKKEKSGWRVVRDESFSLNTLQTTYYLFGLAYIIVYTTQFMEINKFLCIIYKLFTYVQNLIM